ncbi:glutaminase A [Citrobacter sp. JGM124]|uniref:glutaminase A n=1 Tax=Citrobacter sp. JGM124 TaxID=2799789 RepID=UPI001BAA5D30|nr:glutaminase A [Citrobacter sp. JGM124]MBS0849380.1 glutaminase A [Citrobacter sp. JGM124]
MLEHDAIQSAVNDAYHSFGQETGGKNADYIPFLAGVDPSLSGLAVVTAKGDIFTAGDTAYRFAIESISKVCTLALALEDFDPQTIQQKIGADPTGLPFNSVMALELHGDKPLSPLVNAGAMATTSLVKASSAEERWQRILKMQQRLTSSQVAISDELNQSEQTTNFHNKGIAWLLYSAGFMYSDPMEACDVYTRQCSTLLNTVELATLGATIASGGRNPVTNEQVLTAANCPAILAEMTMEGMYDSSGDWAYTVGLPGKSGVGGGILTIAPGKLAIAAFSPPLDPVGNSVRGQKMAAAVAQALKLNLYQC